MSAAQRMWTSFILFGVTFFVFDSGMTEETWPRGIVYGCGLSALLFFLYAMYVFYFDVTRGDRHLQKRGIKATAVVLAAKQTRTQAQTGQADFQAPFIWKYTLQVMLPGKAPYTATCSIARANIPQGTTVNVAVSRFNRASVAILPGQFAGVSSRAENRTMRVQEMFQVVQNQGAVVQNPGSHTPPPQPEANRVDALAKLAELHTQGALTDEEFAAEKARLLQG